MLIAVLLAPVVEETIFRGYIYPVIGRSFGMVWGIVATGTLFGLLHAEQLWGGWGQIALAGFRGNCAHVRARCFAICRHRFCDSHEL